MRLFAPTHAPASTATVPGRRLPHFVGCFLGLCLLACPASIRADSVVVFNEVMYHPSTNEAALEWVELHNQMAVDVDLSGWSISDAIQYTFPKNTVIPGRGYLVVGVSPHDLREATGLTNVLGPFSGRLSNSGETLELRNNNNRLMDEVSYGVDGDWPVAADGSGVSLAKRFEDAASPVAENWTVSALVEGTPGRGNFASSAETNTTRAVIFESVWKYEASGADLGIGWRERGFDDAAWPEGQALFQAGEVTVPPGEIRAVPGVFSTGMNEDGSVLSAGSADPHYWLTLSANGTPPPPMVAATVIQNHPAWVANNAESSWIGPVNPGTTSAAPGNYHYRTQFTLHGLDPSSVVLTFTVGVDDSLADVVLNGISKGISYTGFSSWSSPYSLTSGFVNGTNTLDFLTLNGGTSETPVGLRLNLAGLAREQTDSRTTLPAGRTNYYFRKSFELYGAPGQTAVRLNAIVADGAVFYLNGTEVLRWNLPPGPVSAGTLAISNVPGPLVLGPFDLPNSALRTGNNLLAVEVHSAAGGQTNVLFGAGVTLITTSGAMAPPLTIAFNEVSGSTNDEGWLELINFGVEAVDVSGCVLARHGATDTQYMFSAQQIAAGAHFVVPESLLGGSLASGDRVFCYAPGGSRVLDAVVIRNELRGRWPDGSGSWWFPVAATPGSSNQFAFHDEVVINEVMYHPPIRPAAPAIYGTNRLVSITNTWRYHGQGLEPGPNWIAPGYDDQDWPAGSALFYHTTSLLPAPKLTPLSLVDSEGARIITWYFRTAFSFGGETNGAELTLRPIVDDGAVYYLNGVEIYRQNMPSGVLRYDTLASMGVATPAFSGPFTVPVTNLVAGTNVLAVEVHQFTTNPIAADMAFGVEVSIYDQLAPATPAAEPPGAWVELYNRSTNAVDLTGWRLDEGIDFRFPPGTVIGADGYLVVAQDVAYVRSNCPGITVVG
ncbi:MAG TPA: lamin tail domain-containing protein, partial [Clostridia bacterium]|nr:lamin tail domain-containing protein [Clostridia bacterium]